MPSDFDFMYDNILDIFIGIVQRPEQVRMSTSSVNYTTFYATHFILFLSLLSSKSIIYFLK